MWRFSWVSAFMTLAALSLWGKPAELPFLYELNPPVQQGSGGVLAAQAPELEWSLMTFRAPETRVELRRALPSGGTETAGSLIREGYEARRFQAAVPLAKTAALRFETAFRSSGEFERIDSDGSSLHAFADSDWLMGVSLQKRFKKITASAGGKWIRAKRGGERVDHASAWDIQLAYAPNARWRFGVHARNLSGSDLSSLGAPARVRGETAAGVQHRMRLSSDFALLLSADARFPSPHAAQGSGGAVLVYQNMDWRRRGIYAARRALEGGLSAGRRGRNGCRRAAVDTERADRGGMGAPWRVENQRVDQPRLRPESARR